MNDARTGERYAAEFRRALAAFLADGASEGGRMAAYDLGRRALVDGRSILDLAALHQHTMLDTVVPDVSTTRAVDRLELGEQFFAEVMAPFEMASRGYAQTIRLLETANATLEQRVDARTRALRESERHIARFARLYSILSGINSAIVRLRDRSELLDEACRIAVTHGGFAVAWVALREGAATIRNVTPAAWCSQTPTGMERNRALVDTIIASIPDKIAQVVDANAPMIEHVSAQNVGEGPCPQVAGCRSFALLPLGLGGEVIGVFALYATEPRAFEADEMRLLVELAGDVSFGLEHIRREEEYAYFAYYDALTGLPNVTLLRERLTQQIQAAQHTDTLIALLCIDLVHFSQVNDTFGRNVGDELLRQIGERLKTPIAGDSVARLGADRFAVVLANLPDATFMAHKLETQILSKFTAPFRVGSDDIHLSVRAGISFYPMDATDADTLQKNAEIALKRAQREGERYLVYNAAMNEQVVRSVTLEAKLRRALERDELLLYYQPKVAADTAKLVGLEALVRFSDPESGLVMPSQFVPLLEETGLIIEAGAWVMRRAAADCRQWRGRGLHPPRIAVNVSPIQLRQRQFLDALIESARSIPDGEFGLDIELTESAVMQDVEQNIPKLLAARELGFHIAIDDFGTGYSSLSYLSRLPVNALKIDRSFIIAMADSPSSLAIVTTIISLAHSLGLEVIAEGVEFEEQAKLLRLLRCEQIQGHLYGHALPPDEVVTLLDAGHA